MHLPSHFKNNQKYYIKFLFYIYNKILLAEIMTSESIDIVKEQLEKLKQLFTGKDQLKTNTVKQMRDAGVDIKTI